MYITERHTNLIMKYETIFFKKLWLILFIQVYPKSPGDLGDVGYVRDVREVFINSIKSSDHESWASIASKTLNWNHDIDIKI